jgi:putative MATE family efflux protein
VYPLGQLTALLKDKHFTGKLKAIALPIALQNLINFGINALDTIMLGRIGEVQLSGSALANQLSFMFLVISTGVASGCGVLVAQYWGAGNTQRVREVMSFMYRVVLAISLLFACMAFFVPYRVLGILTTDPEVIAQGVIYLRIMGVGFLFSGFTNSSISILRSTGTVKISVVVYSLSLLINFIGNYALIFGKFGFPAMGIAGAAIATVFARFWEVVIIAIYLFRYEKGIGFSPKDLFHTGEGIVGLYMTHSAPVLINEMLWSTANFILGIIIGRMGREFVAANSISGLMMQFAGIAIFGVSASAGTLVGNAIGAGDYQKARDYANGMLVVSGLMGLVAAAAILLIRQPLIAYYEISELARGYAEQMTLAVAGLVVFQSIALVSMMGTLRGGGDTRFVMLLDVVFIWGIAIPFGALAGLVLNWPVVLVYIILKSEDIFKTLAVLWRVPRGKWLRDITRS